MIFQDSIRMAFAKAMHRVNSVGISISEISTAFLSENRYFRWKSDFNKNPISGWKKLFFAFHCITTELNLAILRYCMDFTVLFVGPTKIWTTVLDQTWKFNPISPLLHQIKTLLGVFRLWKNHFGFSVDDFLTQLSWFN